jgi:hypothetical protein
MTFLGKDDRQYVVVAAGGGSFLGAARVRTSSRSRCRAVRRPAGDRMRRALIAAFGAGVILLAGAAPHAQPRKRVLAWADVRNGYQHDSISHAVATIERLGRESGAYDTFIRTDSQLITKRPITFPPGTGIASGEQFNVHNLNDFDAIFFFGVREIDLTPEQRADLLSFVRDDGKDSLRRIRRRRRSSRGRSSAKCWAAGSTSIPGTSSTAPSSSTIRRSRRCGTCRREPCSTTSYAQLKVFRATTFTCSLISATSSI